MSLTVETGAGIAGADSYNSVADITTYGTENAIDTTAWAAGTTAQKEAWARQGARVLDGRWGYAYPGDQASSEQGLLWPRSDACDREGWSISSAEVPQQILDAHAYLAILAATDGPVSDQAASASIAEVEAASGARVKFGSSLGYQQYREVDYILSTLLAAVAKGRRA